MSKCTFLWLADNLDFLRTQVYPDSVDLIYIDPPFNSKRNYNIIFKTETNTTEQAFSDIWSNVTYLEELDEINGINPQLYSFLKLLESTGLPPSYLSYLTHMAIRCFYMRRALRDTGSFYYHCDPTMSHYIKIMLDYIFGKENFRNEIVWAYTGPGNCKTAYPRKHDILFFYTKGSEYSFNFDAIRIPYKKLKTGKTQAIFKKDHKLNEAGKIPESWWSDISPVGRLENERLGYPTQKPEALLERIIKASSNEGDMVADFYLGGGTTAAVAYKLDRNFIGCDINYRAIQISKERLEKLGATLKKDLIIKGIPNSSRELRKLIDENIVGADKNSRFELEEIVVKYYLKNVVGNDNKRGDNSIDGRFGFTYNGHPMKGIVQVTCASNKNHLKAFCSEVGKGTGDIGVYITFQDCITDGFVKEVKSYGKLGNVDRIQLLSLEDLIDHKKTFSLPTEEE